MTMKKILLTLALLSMCVGCEQPTVPAGVDQDPTEDISIQQRSALPVPIEDEGVGSCPGAPKSEWRGHEPSLAAWVDVADTIFVGTVADVAPVDSPAYLREVEDSGAPVFSKLSDVGECPEGGRIQWAMQIDFEDVETLHGDDVGESFSIQMGLASSVHLGVYYSTGKSYPVDSHGNRVYHPGARVGAALFLDADGNRRWWYRQFEVISDTVHLQEIDEDAVAQCYTEPLVTSIPDQYDGVPFSDFVNAVQNADRPLTAEESSAIAARHANWVKGLATGESKMLWQTICHPAFDPPSEPEEGDRDPNTSP